MLLNASIEFCATGWLETSLIATFAEDCEAIPRKAVARRRRTELLPFFLSVAVNREVVHFEEGSLPEYLS